MHVSKMLGLALVVVTVLLSANGGLAHKILVDALVREDGKVQVEAFFPDGSPAKNMKVEIFSPDGSLFKEGKTDMEGRFLVTPIGPAGTWGAVVTGMMGHRAETKFEVGTLAVSKEAIHMKPPMEVSRETKGLAHKKGIPWFRIIAGLGFIFSLAALIMQLKLQSEWRQKHASTGN